MNSKSDLFMKYNFVNIKHHVLLVTLVFATGINSEIHGEDAYEV